MRLFAIVAVAMLGACATITRGTTQEFVVESTPPGAWVRTSNGFGCIATPCTFRMPRKDGFTVDVELEGYLPGRAVVTSDVSGAGAAGMAGNVIFGGLIGIGVDSVNGATKDLHPNPLHITLLPLPAPAEETVDQEAPAPGQAVSAPAGGN